MSERRAFPKSVQAGIPRLGPKPHGWTTYNLGELLEIVERPIRLKPQEQYQLVTAKRSRGGIVQREKLKGQSIKTKTQFVAKSGDFLISRRQIAHGACGIVPSSLDSAVVSNEYATLLPTDRLDIDFFKHLTNTIYFQQTCFHSSIGVHVEKLVFNLEHWMTWHFHLPPLPEQQRIAAILDEWDNAIATLEKLVQSQQRRKGGLIKSIFFGDANWFDASISELADIVGGGTPSTNKRAYWDGDIPWCTPTDITGLDTRYVKNTERTISDAGLAASNASLLPVGSIILCSRASVGECAINLVPMATNQGFQSLIPKDQNDRYFLYYLVQAYKHELLRLSAGSTFMELPKSALRTMNIRIPETQRRQAIGLVLNDVDDELDQTVALLERLRLQKRGLMQKLLSGDLPVPASIDRLLPGGPCIDPAVGAEAKHAEAMG
ncbi:restriction endonuclease subunit S [Brucella anthropi]|uniref:restriction endonuclease subunit S n=1 Tax=Brucella anthropi TaxID=529 RepID=UPI0007751FFA|nr:restriction endonuclease subunit S [Brucella anthropi]KXO77925.1 hypothetical protein AYJ56_19545 [Brucella anthropi]